jgi:hypothetical protein
MNQRSKDRAAAFPAGNYGVEVLCAGWIPANFRRAEPVPARRDGRLPAVDGDHFLGRFYRLQNA